MVLCGGGVDMDIRDVVFVGNRYGIAGILGVVICLVIGFSCSSCSVLGISDPEVRGVTSEAIRALKVVYDNSSDVVIVKEFVMMAAVNIKLLQNKNLSDLDKKKVVYVLEGLQKVYQKADNVDYVHARSRSLITLINSIGLYGDDGLREIVSLFEQQPQTQSSDNRD